MDRVRFGRALGMGARQAARTLISAAEAAAAPDPSAGPNSSATSSPRASTLASSQPARSPVNIPPLPQLPQRPVRGLAQGSKRLGEAVWGPFVRLSGVLWLEFTGVFFGIFAAYAAGGAWKLRGDLHQTVSNHDAHVHFLQAAAMALLFGYFCVSSFVRARRHGRGASRR